MAKKEINVTAANLLSRGRSSSSCLFRARSCSLRCASSKGCLDQADDVTFPVRQHSVNGEHRSFAPLRAHSAKVISVCVVTISRPLLGHLVERTENLAVRPAFHLTLQLSDYCGTLTEVDYPTRRTNERMSSNDEAVSVKDPLRQQCR